MKSTDRTILIGVVVLGLAAAFWMLVLSPKRQEASDLEGQVIELEAQVTQAEQAAITGVQAKADFPKNYNELVTLGKAVPVEADTPSLLTQLETLSVKSGVDFQAITLGAGTGASAAPAAPAPAAPAAAPGAVPTTAPASEATAALLPIGATVGPAGLPVMPYDMRFEGGFFQIADFFGQVDGMVDSHGDSVSVDGRLLTIDGFELIAGSNGFPQLTADVHTTSYLTPVDQGITAGATPSGPASLAVTPATDTPTDPAAAAPAVAPAVMAN